jgi:hypothetical protein
MAIEPEIAGDTANGKRRTATTIVATSIAVEENYSKEIACPDVFEQLTWHCLSWRAGTARIYRLADSGGVAPPFQPNDSFENAETSRHRPDSALSAVDKRQPEIVALRRTAIVLYQPKQPATTRAQRFEFGARSLQNSIDRNAQPAQRMGLRNALIQPSAAEHGVPGDVGPAIRFEQNADLLQVGETESVSPPPS